jgi:hypothetical protein
MGDMIRLNSKCLAVATLLGAMASFVTAASANVVTFDLNQYASAVDSTAGQTLAVLTLKDIVGGVDVKLALQSPATYFAATGGPHITLAFNVDKTIAYSAFTFTPVGEKSDFTFVTSKNAGTTFGSFTDGIDGTWNGTSNHFGGPIEFAIAGLTTADFGANANGYYAVTDALGPQGTGEIGGNSIVRAVPEPATWAMFLLGFGAIGFAMRTRRRAAAATA